MRDNCEEKYAVL